MSSTIQWEESDEHTLDLDVFLRRYTLHDGWVTEVTGQHKTEDGVSIQSISMYRYIWWQDFNAIGNLRIEFENGLSSEPIWIDLIIHDAEIKSESPNILNLVDNESGRDITISFQRTKVIPDSTYLRFMVKHPTT